MKKSVECLAFFLMIIGFVALAPRVTAEELTQGRHPAIDAIRSQCETLKTTLRQLHTNDTLQRVNIGQTYSTLSAQYMTRLNSRLVLRKINSVEAVQNTEKFEARRRDFSQRYNEYDSAMGKLRSIDCKKQPAEFYAQLIIARDARQKVAETTREINKTLADYQVEIERIRDELKGVVR